MEYIENIFNAVVAWFAQFSFAIPGFSSEDIGLGYIWDSLILAIANAFDGIFS